MNDVVVPVARVERWIENFERRHGCTRLAVADGALTGRAEDGSTFAARLPFERAYAGPAEPGAMAAAAAPPADWGLLLVRKGGFAVARMTVARMVDSKVGKRHVQGRSKAGGWSQQRFARRRGEQARVAYEAAAGHAARILERLDGPLVVGGDRAAVEEVLSERRLAALRVCGSFLTVPDPRRAVLEAAVSDAQSVTITVVNRDAG